MITQQEDLTLIYLKLRNFYLFGGNDWESVCVGGGGD